MSACSGAKGRARGRRRRREIVHREEFLLREPLPVELSSWIPLDPSSPIPFRCSEWFLPYERDSRKFRQPGKECLNHGFCEQVDDMQQILSGKKKAEEEKNIEKVLFQPEIRTRKKIQNTIWTFYEGDTYNLQQLLYSQTRDFLIKSGDHPQQKMYSEMRGTNDHFEIIYISLDCDKRVSSFPKCIQEMPWLVHSFVPDFAAYLLNQVFDCECPPALPAIAAIGPDWQLVGKESNLAFKEEWSSTYPFVKAYSVEEEICWRIMNKYKWDLEIFFHGISSTN